MILKNLNLRWKNNFSKLKLIILMSLVPEDKFIEKFGKDRFMSFYQYKNKICLAIFNGSYLGSVICITKYYDSMDNALKSYVEKFGIPEENGYKITKDIIVGDMCMI